MDLNIENDLPRLLPSNNEENTFVDEGIETYYKMKFDDFEFQYLYKEIGSRRAVYAIDKNGKECASIYVDLNEEDDENDTRELLLSKVIYKPICAIKALMTRGASTIKMLKGLMAFAMKKMPRYPYVVFTDDSHIDCELPGTHTKKEIPLASFEFLLHGKTWYEKHFGAILDEGDVERRSALDHANTLLELPVEGEFKAFWRRMLRHGSKLDGHEWYIRFKLLSQEVFESHMAEKKSWRSFFNELFGSRGIVNTRFGENIGCSAFLLMQTSIETMFKIPQLSQTHWKVLRTTIERYAEFRMDAELNTSPVHIKKSDTQMKLAALADPIFSVYAGGGGKTRRRKRILKKIPPGYGGTISFLATNGGRPPRKGTRKV